ncbi:SGNH/GDSL hydrolase family protein [Streptomyces sp. NBC_00444]|uniref:SGNH/GDSL hydrolase family protein n=1 Tax=Streptomyces sp. NBC_00444 TaxID=2975744 RepID=UPI002E2304B8
MAVAAPKTSLVDGDRGRGGGHGVDLRHRSVRRGGGAEAVTDQDVLGLLVGQIDARNARLSDTIREDFQNYDVKTPGDGFTNWVSFDATISATPTGIDFVIPESEVHTEASWWQNIIAVTVGVAMQIFTRALCLGFLPAAAVVCASIGAFVGTVAGRFTVQGFDHQVTDGEAWAKTKLPELLRRAGEWLKNDLPRHLKGFWSWGKDAAIAAGTGVIRVAGWVYEKGKSFVPEWGSGNLPGRLRIMVVGDSMSQGDEGDWTWHYRLWEWFRNEGVSVDFVGPYRGTKPPADAVTPSPPPLQGEARDESSPPRTWGGYAELQTFDSDHFAVWGRQAAQDKKLIREAVTAYQPDLLLVGLGFNDMGWFVSGPEGTLDSMKELVDQARAAKPDIKFALANVPQRTFIGGREDLPVKTNSYNRMLAAAVPRWSIPSSHVALVDWRGHYSCDVDNCPAGYDGLHPNALGEYQIARAYARTLHDTYGIGTSLPAIPPAAPSRPTPAPSGVVARSVPSGIKVTWDRMYGTATPSGTGSRVPLSGVSSPCRRTASTPRGPVTAWSGSTRSAPTTATRSRTGPRWSARPPTRRPLRRRPTSSPAPPPPAWMSHGSRRPVSSPAR